MEIKEVMAIMIMVIFIVCRVWCLVFGAHIHGVWCMVFSVSVALLLAIVWYLAELMHPAESNVPETL